MGDQVAPRGHTPGDDEALGSRADTRRAFISKTAKRAAYLAPVIWSLTARQAMANSLDGSAFGTTPGNSNGPPPPE